MRLLVRVRQNILRYREGICIDDGVAPHIFVSECMLHGAIGVSSSGRTFALLVKSLVMC